MLLGYASETPQALKESGSHNRRPQVHGRVRQTVYDIDREVVPLSSE
jgi:hypothetical protein